MSKEKEFAKLVKYRRAELGLTQADLARKANVSICVVSFIENAKENVSPKSIVKVSKVLDIDGFKYID